MSTARVTTIANVSQFCESQQHMKKLEEDLSSNDAFQRPDRVGDDESGPGMFDLLGFTHCWVVSRKGHWVVKQRTAKGRFSRALHRLREWYRWHRHDSLKTQHLALKKKLNGHYAYYGITLNFDRIAAYFYMARRIWRTALARRSQQPLPWRVMHNV